MKDKELSSFEGKQTIFERIKEVDENGNEYWTARKLSEILDYSDFRNFIAVIGKAKEACSNSGQDIENHFVDFNEMVLIGSGAKREIENFQLSRYACYLIVQNADPSKEVVALGQTYFAIQTRLQEIQQMDEYTRLDTEKEKRLFLRNQTHFEVGKKVRKTIQELGNPMPENLPTEESIKNLEKEKNKQNKAKLKADESNELSFENKQ